MFWRLHFRQTSALWDSQERLESFPPDRRSTSTLPQSFDFRFQFAYAFLELRKAIEGRGVFQPEAIIDRRRAGTDGVGGNVTRKATLCGDNDAVADGEVAGGSRLTGENAVIADFG
jgi:hypothetical protein